MNPSTTAGSYLRLNRTLFLELNRCRNVAARSAQFAANALARTELARGQLEALGICWDNQRLLEIGSGQLLRYTLPFSTIGHVSAIDTELPLQRPYLRSFAAEVRHNGLYRAGKSLVNVLLRRPQSYRRAIEKAAPRPFSYEVFRMDAGRLGFPDGQFGGAFSFSVFEHLPEPDRALGEIARCLRPGASLYLDLHLYTSPNGDHDPRGLRGAAGWRPWQHLLGEGPPAPCFLNRLRLDEWRQMIARFFREVRFVPLPQEQARNRRLLTPELRQRLRDFTDDELLTTTLIAVATK